MDLGKDMVCRLCFRVSYMGATLIDEITRQILEILLVKMNLDVSNKPLMCDGCAEIIKKSLYFMMMCLETERTILLLNIDENKTNVDLKVVYAHNSKNVVNGDDDVCRFCIQKVEQRNAIPLDVLLRENTFSDMVPLYLFQMDLKIIKNPLICIHCRGDMQSYFHFLRNCHDTEEKINVYRQIEGKRSGDKVLLKNVFETFSKYAKQEEICNVITKIKEEFCMEHEEVFRPLPYHSGEMNNHITCMCERKDGSCFRCCARFTETALDKQDIKLETEELIVKNEDILSEISDFPKIQGYRCEICEYQTKHKSTLKNHLLIHKDFSEVQVYQCNSCEFQTKHKYSLKKHMLTHKDFSEVQVYRCDSCQFQTKHKSNLKRHQVTHKNFSEVQVYQCDRCELETKRKYSLKRHLLTHKDVSEVQVYQCNSCEYQTKWKYSLKKHKLAHKVYRCDSCQLQTKRKDDLKKHWSTRKEYRDVQVYHCDTCEYHTKRKYDLKVHQLSHKDISEVQVYQCDSCKFQTKHKSNLKKHSLIHKDISELPVYQCDSCEYQARHKHYLMRHLYTHR